MLKKGLFPILLATFLVSLMMANFVSAKKYEKKTKRGWLGVYVQDITTDIKEAMELKSKKGVLVRDVVEDSPADEAGIEREDVILVFNGKKIDDSDELIRLVRRTSPGDEVELVIVRDGKKETLTLTMGKTPKNKLQEWRFPEFKPHKFKPYSYSLSIFSGSRIGVKVQDLNDQLGEYFGVEDGEGVLVTEVDEDGPAYEAGLRAGDVIVEADDEEIDDVDDLMEVISDKEERDKLIVKVIRDRKERNFTVEVEEGEEWSYDYLRGLEKLKVLPLPEKFREPRVFWEEKEFREREEWREEFEELKEELEELKEELEDLKQELR